jgi:hypothetical protein
MSEIGMSIYLFAFTNKKLKHGSDIHNGGKLEALKKILDSA